MTKNRPVRIAIIGAGAVSEYYHVAAIRLDPRAELVAVCDSSQARLDARQHDWHVEFLTDNYEKVCGHDEVDAVSIATPHDTSPNRSGGSPVW
jgi:predicted dehydrogenase